MRVITLVPLLVLSLLSAGCPADEPLPAVLEVVLRSDLSAGELAGAGLRIEASGEAAGPFTTMLASSSLPTSQLAGRGAVVAALRDVPAGRYEVVVEVMGGEVPEGTRGSALVDFAGAGAQQVIVLVVRDPAPRCTVDADCPDVACATDACVDGRCFAVRTDAFGPDCDCDTDDDCAGIGACGTGRCADHTCTVTASDEACGLTGVCRPDFSCDPVSCRGRAAGDTCRAAVGPCDRRESCVAGARECPPDRRADLGDGCLAADGAVGFCSADEAGVLSCDTRCVAGATCREGCRVGRMTCVPEPACDTSDGEVAADGSLCSGVAECLEPSRCLAGTCVEGSITVAAPCGITPPDPCLGQPLCTAAGVCETQVVPDGAPCGEAADAPLCTTLVCNHTVCSPRNVPTDPRCVVGPVGECGAQRCGFRSPGSWTCAGFPDFDACTAPPCQMAFCRGDLVCERMDVREDEPCDCGAASSYCSAGVCRDCTHCNDGVVSGGESDVDCGGDVECPACNDGQRCTEPFDCASGYCVDGTCQSPCSDGVRGGGESDVDCGGGLCPACPTGRRCARPDDCLSEDCDFEAGGGDAGPREAGSTDGGAGGSGVCR